MVYCWILDSIVLVARYSKHVKCVKLSPQTETTTLNYSRDLGKIWQVNKTYQKAKHLFRSHCQQACWLFITALKHAWLSWLSSWGAEPLRMHKMLFGMPLDLESTTNYVWSHTGQFIYKEFPQMKLINTITIFSNFFRKSRCYWGNIL